MRTQALFAALLDSALDDDYQAYINKLVSLGYGLPPIAIQLAQNKLVVDLKAASLWTRMKTGYFFHTGSKDTCRVNLKNPNTYALTPAGVTAVVPIQIQGVGMRSSGGVHYDQPFKSNEYSGIETDLTVIQYMPFEPFASIYAENSYSHGMDVTAAGATDNYIGLIPFHSASQGFRGHGGAAQTFVNTTHQGLYVHTHDGTNSVVYKDGVKTSTALTPSTPDNSIDRFIMSTNNDGTASTPKYNRLIAADFLYDRFNDADEASFRSIWTTFINSISINFQYVAEYASHCWFTRNKSAYDSGTNKSWIGQCHNDAFAPSGTGYYQYIIEIFNNSNAIGKFKLGTVAEQDDHNEPSILIRSSDSRLFVVYSEHGGSVLRWRASTNVLSASAWGAEQTLDPVGGGTHDYTYPSVFEASNGHLYIFFRDQLIASGISGWSYVKSTNGGSTFGGYTRLDNVTYSAIAQDPNDKDLLHFVKCYHPIDALGTTDNYIMHGYFDCSTDTLHKSDGTDITASMPVTEAHYTIIETFLDANDEDCWLEDIIVDSSGNPRILFNKIPDMPTAILKDQYYTEWTGSAWTTPHLLGRTATHYMETELLVTDLQSIWYAPLGSFDRANPDRIFSSIETAGHFGNVCEIWELDRVSSSSFTRVQRTFDSSSDQWRPFTIESPTNNVFWLDKLYYDHWLNGYFQVLKLRTFQ